MCKFSNVLELNFALRMPNSARLRCVLIGKIQAACSKLYDASHGGVPDIKTILELTQDLAKGTPIANAAKEILKTFSTMAGQVTMMTFSTALGSSLENYLPSIPSGSSSPSI